jgi:hypothetical protein
LIIVDQVLKGDFKDKEKKVLVEYEGGEVDGIGMGASDVPQLEEGEEVILFLKSGKSRVAGNVQNVVGAAQGKYSIGEDGIARKGGFSVVGPNFGKEKEGIEPKKEIKDIIDNDIPADKLIKKIKKIVKETTSEPGHIYVFMTGKKDYSNK